MSSLICPLSQDAIVYNSQAVQFDYLWRAMMGGSCPANMYCSERSGTCGTGTRSISTRFDSRQRADRASESFCQMPMTVLPRELKQSGSRTRDRGMTIVSHI